MTSKEANELMKKIMIELESHPETDIFIAIRPDSNKADLDIGTNGCARCFMEGLIEWANECNIQHITKTQRQVH